MARRLNLRRNVAQIQEQLELGHPKLWKRFLGLASVIRWADPYS